MGSAGFQPVEVSCHSGHTYAERPISFRWEGREHRVEKVEREWREPGQRCFQVLSGEDKRFELRYQERGDEWSLVEIIGYVRGAR